MRKGWIRLAFEFMLLSWCERMVSFLNCLKRMITLHFLYITVAMKEELPGGILCGNGEMVACGGAVAVEAPPGQIMEPFVTTVMQSVLQRYGLARSSMFV